MGGRQEGRSEPAFRVASTPALPPPTSLNKARGRPLHLPAVFAARPVPVGSSAGCFTARLVSVSFTTGLFCYNGLVMPCHALSACLCHDPMPAALVAFAPFLPSIHYHVRQDHRASCRDCPVGSRNTGLHWRTVHRFLFTALISKGEA